MQQYLVSARKYRPSTFKSVVGQRALTNTIKNAIATGRLAHSYLFCGSRGVGKTSCARIMAKTINCEHPTADGEACNECASCRSFNDGNSLNIIELDAASNNSVDDIRSLIDQVQMPPANGRYRVFIVDEVHMLSAAAFNAFLKTLEEPPSYVIFILATTEKHKILPTILSRCQIYDFARITIQDMIEHLAYVAEQEGITAETAALNIIARKADGAMRDALSIFDQVAASSRGNITYAATLDNLNVLDYEYYNRLTDCFLRGDVLSSWLIYKEIRDRGFDSQFFINGLADYFRDLMVARDPRTASLLEAGDEARAAMAQWSAKCDPSWLYQAMDLCNQADFNYRTASNKQFLIELTLAKLCQLLSPSPDSTADGRTQGLKPIAAAHPDTTPITPAARPQPQEPRMQQAQPPVQPHPVSRPKATSPAPAPAHTGSRLSIRGLRPSASQSEHTSAPEAPAQARAEAYTDDDLKSRWNAWAEAHPTERILVNTMRTALPLRQDNDPTGQYTVTVENEHQHQLLTERLPELLTWLRDGLRNDAITIAVAINRGETSPTTWNDREVLSHLTAAHPEFAKFVADLDLRLF